MKKKYRTISLDNPFLNRDGTVRNLDTNSNWYEKENTINADIYLGSPKYTFILTPALMRRIRDDNKKIKYNELSAQTYEKFKKDFAEIFK